MARKSRKNLALQPIVAVTTIQYRAAAYTRLSSDDKRKRGDSLETQRNIIDNYVAMASDICIEENYSDNNMTGTNFERPAFQKMLSDCENGRINCIIVKDLSRFGRNSIDTGFYLEMFLPRLGVRFIAVTDDYDSNDGDGGILLHFKSLLAERYAIDIGYKCRSTWQLKIEAGEFIGRLAPYGYSKSPDNCHKLIVNPETAPVVRQIFEWAASSVRMNEISRRLNKSGLLSPGHYNKVKGESVSGANIGNGYWHKTTLKNMLSDRVYCGDLVQGKDRQYNNKRISMPPEKWVTVENTHEPIVSRDLFNTANERISQLAAQEIAKRSPTVSFTANIFQGKIFCARCGRPMHRKRQNKDGIYWYRCPSQDKYGKAACTIVSVKEHDLKVELLTMLQVHSQVLLGRYIALERAVPSKEDFTLLLNEINIELNKTAKLSKSLYESMVTELITRDEYIQMKTDFENEISDLSTRADKIRFEQRNALNKVADYYNFADATSAVLSDERFTTELIAHLIDSIQVNPDKSVNISLKYRNEFTEVA